MVPKLHDIQQAFGDSIYADDARLAEHVIDDGIAAADRLRIYRNTAFSVLTDALRLVYPAVSRLVGVEFFDGAAAFFIRRHPPREAYLGNYGREFVTFLSGFGPAASVPYLADVARFEWALNVAANSLDAATVEPATLASLDPADHAAIHFEPHTSVRLLKLTYPADRIADAVMARDDGAMAAIDLDSGPIWLIVHRGVDGVEATRFTELEWQFTEQLLMGRPLGAASAAFPSVDAGTLLANHLLRGRLCRFSVSRPLLGEIP
jgi:hypothetical protein